MSRRPNIHASSALLRAMMNVIACACFAAGLLDAPPLRADVITSGDKPKKEPKDKKKDDKDGYLPEARPSAGRFISGQATDVELVAAVGSLRQMEFVIRQMPKNGTLSAIRPDLREGNKAVVTYTHRGGDAPLMDAFTYACRLDGGAWSAPATVTLVGERLQPRIEVVNLPQFARVFLGGESSARIVVRNKGTADFHTEVKWPEPFTGPPVVDVPRGGSQEFEVIARPAKTGDFRHEMVLQPDVPESKAIFYVVCVQALSVSPSHLTLVLDGKDGERSGVLSLANAREQPVRVVMKHPARLLAPEETEVAASSRSDLRIALPGGDVVAFSGEIVVVAGEDVQTVSVEASPKPAVLQVLVPASRALDFGVVDQYTTPSREVVLSNVGGKPLVVEARVRPPFSLGEAVKSARIEPHAQSRLRISLQTDRPGQTGGELNLDSNSTRMTVTLSAEVHEVKATEPPVLASQSPQASKPSSPPASAKLEPASDAAGEDVFSRRTPAQRVLMAVAASKGLPPPPSMISPYLPSIPSIEFISSTPSEITIAWPRPAMIPPGWLIETASQVFDPGTGMFIKLWTRHRDWETVNIDGDRIAVRLQKLTPGSLYEVRVLAVDREGKVSEPAATKLIQTAPPWRVPPWVWRTLIAITLGAVAACLYRVRHGSWGLAPRLSAARG
jgi:hypothetical protein